MNNKARHSLAVRCWLICLALAGLYLAGCAAQAPVSGGPPVSMLFPKLKLVPELKSKAFVDEIQLSWTKIPGAASYNLYWSDEPGVIRETGEKIAGLKTTLYRHRGLKQGRTYYYEVTAVTAKGEESAPLGRIYDVPYNYEVRGFPGFIAVVPRLWDTFDSLAKAHLGNADKGWLIQDFNAVDTVTPFKALLIPKRSYEPGGLTAREYKTVPVLVYHDLSLSRANRMTVPRASFELQMAFLKRNRYRVITLDQFMKFLEFKGGVPDRAVVITFDDGWVSTHELAYPILKKYGFQATLFIYTDLIGATKKSLSWDQVRALDKSGVIDVQCHTKSHRSLRIKRTEDLRQYVAMLQRELSDSRNLVKKELNKECRYLAYPYGTTNHLVIAMAQKEGYEAAFTVDRGSNPFFVTNYRVLRSMIYGNYDLKQFEANLTTSANKVLK